MPSSKKLGYDEALQLVTSVRSERRRLYGDGFKSDPDWCILAEIRQKAKRLEMSIMHQYDRQLIIDSCIDLCNYSLFLLQNKLDEKKAKRRKI